jgi:hypothetical protein
MARIHRQERFPSPWAVGKRRRPASEVVPYIRVPLALAHYLDNRRWVCFHDLRQPSNGRPFLLAGHQCIGLPHSGQVAVLMPHLPYAKSRGESVRQVRQEPVFLC